MPTRHLSDEQRQRYARFDATPSLDQLARYFHMDRGDREVVDGLRGDLIDRFNFSRRWPKCTTSRLLSLKNVTVSILGLLQLHWQLLRQCKSCLALVRLFVSDPLVAYLYSR